MENIGLEVCQVQQEDSELLTYKQAARVLRIPVGTLYSWVHHRKIEYVRLCGGRVVRFPLASLQRLIQESTIRPKTRELPPVRGGNKS